MMQALKPPVAMSRSVRRDDYALATSRKQCEPVNAQRNRLDFATRGARPRRP